MNRLKLSIRVFVLATVLSSLLLTSGVVKAAPLSHGTWSIVPSANFGSNACTLHAVAAVSASDVWAVGWYYNISINAFQTLTEHWNGTSWSGVPSPNASSGLNQLYSVAAVSTNDVWAVGEYLNNSNGNTEILIEHWDGSSWSVVSSPNPGLTTSALYGVTAVSASNIWAVGYANSSSIDDSQGLVEQWNGTSWSVVSGPTVGSSSYLEGVTQVPGSSNLWAVGNYLNSSAGTQTLIEQWNGTSWNVVSSPNVGSGANALLSAAASSANGVWSVGEYLNKGGTSMRTLIEHWNGSQWSFVPSPKGDGFLSGVAAVPDSNKMWAVGYYLNTAGYYQTLIELWNGTRWSGVVSPDVSSSENFLYNVTAVPDSTSMWAVGYYCCNVAKTLTEQFS